LPQTEQRNVQITTLLDGINPDSVSFLTRIYGTLTSGEVLPRSAALTEESSLRWTTEINFQKTDKEMQSF
jgi:hypothetical protein